MPRYLIHAQAGGLGVDRQTQLPLAAAKARAICLAGEVAVVHFGQRDYTFRGVQALVDIVDGEWSVTLFDPNGLSKEEPAWLQRMKEVLEVNG